MTIIKVNKDKSLCITKWCDIYQYDNNSDYVTFYIPQTIDGIDISNSIVRIRMITPDGDIIDNMFSDLQSVYIDYYVCEVPVTSDITDTDGKIETYIEFEGENEMYFRTESTEITVKPNYEKGD